MDKTFEIEKEFFFGRTDLDETLTMIRNSFSHIGRITLLDNRMNLIFNDYSDEGIKSGFVTSDIISLIKLIEFPIPEKDLAKSEVEVKHLVYKR